jgi:hypothetical protein
MRAANTVTYLLHDHLILLKLDVCCVDTKGQRKLKSFKKVRKNNIQNNLLHSKKHVALA